MAKENNRLSFVMYTEWGMIFRELPDSKCKQLICSVYDYVENGVDPDFEDDILMKISWNQIWHQLERDYIKYEETRKKRAEAGKQGGVASGYSRSKIKQNEANEANASNAKQNEANEAVDVDVDVSENVDKDVCVVVNNDEPSGTPQSTTQKPSLEEVMNELLSVGFTEEQSEKASREFYQYNESHDWKFLPYAKWQDKLDGWIGRDVTLKDEYKKLKNKKARKQAEAEEEERRQREFDEKYWDNDSNRYGLNHSPEDFADYIYGDRHYYGDDEFCRRMHDFFIPEELEQMYKDGAVEMGDPDRYVIGLYERGKCEELIIHFMKRHVRSCGIVPFVWKSRDDELEELSARNYQMMDDEEDYGELPFE